MKQGRVREEWEIRDDARTLARAEEIKADKDRYNDATAMARKLADEDIDRVKGMLRVAGKRVPKSQQETVKTQPTFSNRRGGNNPAVIGRL